MTQPSGVDVGLGVTIVLVGIPAGWALIWAFCVAVNKWKQKP